MKKKAEENDNRPLNSRGERVLNKDVWKKMGKAGQDVFCEVFESMNDQSLVCHPDAQKIPENHWDTIKHNAAFVAGFAVREWLKKKAMG